MDFSTFEGFCLKQNVLIESVSRLRQDYSKIIPSEVFDGIIKSDPTYNPDILGGDKEGKYTRWIIKLVANYYKNQRLSAQYDEFIKQNPNGLEGRTINKPVLEQNVLMPEDIYKCRETFTKFERYKNLLEPNERDINRYKNLPEVASVVRTLENEGVSEDEKVNHALKLFKRARAKGLRIVYRDEVWLVGIPETKESSVVFGDDTSWCTTQNSMTYYEHYTNQGPLYINLNKKTGELYQFHFESRQFMDADNEPLYNLLDFFENSATNQGLKGFYFNKIKASYIENDYKKMKDEMERQGLRVVDFSENERGKVVHFKGNYDSIECIYRGGEGSCSFEFVEKILDGDGLEVFYDSYYPDSTDVKNAVDSDEWLEKISPLTLSWDDFVGIGEDEADLDEFPLTVEQIRAIQELYDDGNGEFPGVKGANANARMYGTEEECRKQIIDDIKTYIDIIDSVDEVFHFSLGLDYLLELFCYSEMEDDYDEWTNLLVQWYWAENGREEYFSIEEPYYGWDGFDDKYWEESVNSYADGIKEILNGENQKEDRAKGNEDSVTADS